MVIYIYIIVESLESLESLDSRERAFGQKKERIKKKPPLFSLGK